MPQNTGSPNFMYVVLEYLRYVNLLIFTIQLASYRVSFTNKKFARSVAVHNKHFGLYMYIHTFVCVYVHPADHQM